MDEAPGLARQTGRRGLTGWLARRSLRSPLASPQPARPTACSPAHVRRGSRFAFSSPSGVLANYGLLQTGARLGVVGLCAKRQVLSSGHPERNVGKPPAAEPKR